MTALLSVEGREAPSSGGSISPLPTSLKETMTGSSWHRGCPVGLDGSGSGARHWGFDGRVHTGRLVVNRDVAQDMLRALRRLYAARFPIRRMVPVDAYGASDFRSIEADNTSAFNCRYVEGTTRWSEHCRPAIDLNPIENPYVSAAGTTSHGKPFLPSAGAVPVGHGGRGRRRGAGVRGGRLGLGRAVVGRPRLPALLRERPLRLTAG